MKFYLSNTDSNKTYEASPYAVSVGDVQCFYTDTEAFPIIITLGNRVCFGAPGSEHDDVLSHIGETESKAQGRFWRNHSVLVFWNENKDITKENIELVTSALRDRAGVNPDSIRLFLDCGFGGESVANLAGFGRESMANLIVEMTPREYLSSGVYGANTKYFWDLYLAKRKLSAKNGAAANNGIDSKDIWRHYERVDESAKGSAKKINKNTLRRIITESVIKVLEENFPVLN